MSAGSLFLFPNHCEAFDRPGDIKGGIIALELIEIVYC